MLLTQDQEMIRDAVRDFAQTELWPHAARWDKEHHFPKEAHQGLAALAPGVVTHGGDDAAAVFGVLAHQLQPNAARCTDDEDGLHGKYFNQIGL